MTLTELLLIDGFEELLERNISEERFATISNSFLVADINIKSVLTQDGHTNEWLINKSRLKIIIKAVQDISKPTYEENEISTRLDKLNEINRELILMVLKTAHKLGVGQDKMMNIFDEVLNHIGMDK